MSLFAILSTSRHSLAAHRARTHVASHNIANVSTEGYSRRRVNLEDMPEYMVMGARVGAGVIAESVTRMRDRFLEAEVTTTYAKSGQASAEHTALVRFRAFDVDAPHNVQDALDGFFAAMRDVLSDPESIGSRQAAVGAAGTLANAVRSTAESTETARSALDVDIAAHAEESNGLAQEIAALNVAIFQERAVGKEPNDLLDQRDMAAARLAELTGASVVPDDDGNVNMFLDGRHALVVGAESGRLSYAPDAANRGHLAVSLTSTDGLRTTALGLNDFSGQIGGQLSARDVTLKAVTDGLDTFAQDFATLMNTQHQAGFGLGGQTGLDLFVPAATLQGAALNFAVDPTVAGDPSALAVSDDAAAGPGNNGNMLALVGLESSTLPSGQDPAGALLSIASNFASATKRAEAQATQETALRDRLDEMRLGVSGVSVDEEMIELTEAQRAFEAVGKVIRTTDSLLETVIGLK